MVLVANSEARDSVAIARHYAQVRGVPAANIIALKMPLAETISWREFVGTVWQPLESELVKRGWIDAIAMDLFDAVGRRKYAVSGHRITALVLCRGVPLRIADDPSLYAEVPPLTDHAEMRTNQGAVDSELSLLARTDYPINACLPNPLFNSARPTDDARAQVVKVSRLDGPTAADALHLVDLAVEAERTGLLGRAYVDIAGPNEKGDRWLEEAAASARSLGFDVSIGHGPATFPASARIDAPALYLGWYAPDLNGPFALPGFRFPPGAVALHMHSFSAHTLRSATEGWCGPLIAQGRHGDRGERLRAVPGIPPPAGPPHGGARPRRRPGRRRLLRAAGAQLAVDRDRRSRSTAPSRRPRGRRRGTCPRSRRRSPDTPSSVG